MAIADKTLFLVRHGTTAANFADILQGRADNPLSEAGLAEAERLAAHLRGRNIEAIFCSTLTRARQTAEAVGRACGLPVETIAELVEIDLGEWEGRPYDELKNRADGFYQRWREDPSLAIPGGESFLAVMDRARIGLRRVLSSPARRVTLVGHAAVNQAILAVLLGMEPGVARRFRSRNASLAQISMYLEGDRWTGVVDCWNLAAYLEDTK